MPAGHMHALRLAPTQPVRHGCHQMTRNVRTRLRPSCVALFHLNELRNTEAKVMVTCVQQAASIVCHSAVSVSGLRTHS